MFRASPCPSSGTYNCTRSLWFYRWREAAGALLVVFWQVTCQNTSVVGRVLAGYLPEHDQQHILMMGKETPETC
jgi:hypothetical protein